MNYSVPKEGEAGPRFNSYEEYVDYFNWLLDQGIEGINFAAWYHFRYSSLLFRGYEITRDIKNHKNYNEFYEKLRAIIDFRASYDIISRI